MRPPRYTDLLWLEHSVNSRRTVKERKASAICTAWIHNFNEKSLMKMILILWQFANNNLACTSYKYRQWYNAEERAAIGWLLFFFFWTERKETENYFICTEQCAKIKSWRNAHHAMITVMNTIQPSCHLKNRRATQNTATRKISSWKINKQYVIYAVWIRWKSAQSMRLQSALSSYACLLHSPFVCCITTAHC